MHTAGHQVWTELIGHVIGSCSRRLRPGCRVLELGSSEAGLICRLADSLPDCTIIVLDHDGRLSNTRRAGGNWPANIEVLSCGIEGANFLPGTIAAAIAARDDWPALRVLVPWLEPGGRLVLMSIPGFWRRWLRLLGFGRDAAGTLRRAGLIPEPRPGVAFKVFRKGA